MSEENKQPRRRAAWRDDFDGTMDQLGNALGGVVRYDSEYHEIICRTDAGLDIIGEGIPDRHAAYWWARGRLALEMEND